jgi:hypothetical protein
MRPLAVAVAVLALGALVVVTPSSGGSTAPPPCGKGKKAPPCDTTPPSAPPGLVVTLVTTSSVGISWTASTDNVGVAGYDLLVGGVRIGTTADTSYTFAGLSCATSYSLSVDAFDTAGNRSSQASLAASTSACGPADGVGTSLPGRLAPSAGTTFYVSTSGSDANAGTLTAPWRTVQKALNTLRAGQQALVRGGTYTENLLMTRSGTATAPITLAAYPGETVVLHAASASDAYGDWVPVQIYSTAYFRLSGFVIENSLGTSSANVYVSGTSNHVELSGNEIRYGQDQGVLVDYGTNTVQLLANRIHDNGWNHLPGQHQSHGIYLEGGNDLVANNVIYDHPYGFGLQIYPGNHDSIVVDNTIAASGHSAIVVGGSTGVYNITIRNNILYGDNWGVEVDSTCPTGPVTIDHNVIYAYRYTPVETGCSRLDTSAGNILADPLFLDYPNRNLQLQAASPAVDRASSPWSATADAAGLPRPQGAAPDTGAFER